MKLKHIYGIVVLFTSWIATAQTFQDNVTNETIGDFPNQWDIVGGMATVNQQDGYKYIGFRSGGIIKPIVNGQTNHYLSSDFTVEFDVFFDQTSALYYNQSFQLRLWDGAYGYDKDGIRYKPFMIYRDGLETDWNHPEMGGAKNHLKEFQTLDPVWRHVKVEVKEGKLKILMDDKLILFLPRFKMQPTMLSIGGSVNDSRFDANIGFTNFTITNILPQTKVVMLVDKETDAVVDINLLSNIKNNTALQESYSNTVAYLGSITGNYTLRPVDVADVKKPNISTNPINNQTLRPVDVADVKKPINVDVNAYGKYTVMPAKEAQLVFDFDTKYETRKLGITPTQTIVANQQSWLGNYFESNTTLPLTSHELTLENGTLKLIGETEKNLDTPIDGGCGAYPTEAQRQVLADPNSLFNKRLEFLENYSIEDLRGVPAVQYINGQFMLPQQVRFSTSATENFTIIPIVVHILRLSNGTDGLTLQTLYQYFNRANELFEKYGVHLNIEKINYIDDDDTFNFVYRNQNVDNDDLNDEVIPLKIPDRNVKQKLNVYYVPNTQGSTPDRTSSWSKFPAKGYGNQHIIMNNTHDGGVLVHEIGHWFNLLHTHETANLKEMPSGFNCKISGDFCCDTPADPNLDGKVDANCNYTEEEMFMGGYYNPDTSNVMSYTSLACRENFSDEQIKRMYNAYLGMEDDRGYTFTADNEIGTLVKQYNWTTGWNQMDFFKKNNEPYMYFFKTSTGDIAIHKMNNDGSQGIKTYTGKFGSGWTSTLLFANKYLFMHKSGNGKFQIRKINNDGTLGAVKSGQMESGNWHFNFISMEGGSYLIAINKIEPKIQVFKINSEGNFGGAIYEKSLSPDYNVYKVIDNKLIRYNSNSGKLSILNFQSNGNFRVSTTSKEIDKNFNNISYIPFYNTSTTNTNNSTYDVLLYNKDSGQIIKHQWVDDTFGEKWYDSKKLKSNLTDGFDVVTPYNLTVQNQNVNFLMLSNSNTGKVEIYKLNKIF